MGKMTIKKKGKKKIKVPYDQELNDLKEWQDHQYTPGYYMGTGRMPYPLKKLGNRPKLKWLYLLFIFGPIVIGAAFNGIFNEISLQELLVAALVIGVFAWIVYDSKKHLRR